MNQCDNFSNTTMMQTIDETQKINNDMYNQVLKTVDLVKELDYIDKNALPTIFNMKMQDKFHHAVEAMQVSRDHRAEMANPYRMVAKLENIQSKKIRLIEDNSFKIKFLS